MDYKNLTIIGERINPGFKSSKALFDNNDIEGIKSLAVEQLRLGASYLNFNAGQKGMDEPQFLRDVVVALQSVVDAPLSFDSPNLESQRICFEAYGKDRPKPLINSISELRWELTELLRLRPCKVLLMASERNENGERIPNKTADEVFDTARRMSLKLLHGGFGLTPDDIYIDVSVGPVAADMEGLTRMAIQAIRKIGAAPELKGVHMSVGLSNISIMVPAKASDGSPLKLLLESAFLTNTVPYGLDTIIGTAGRDYKILPKDNFVQRGFDEAMELDDVESIMRIQALYKEA